MRFLKQTWSLSLDARITTEECRYTIGAPLEGVEGQEAWIYARYETGEEKQYRLPLYSKTPKQWKGEILDYIRALEEGKMARQYGRKKNVLIKNHRQ